MAKQDYQYYHQVDCKGGINEEPENAQPNQLLDARNVWCPDGRLEQRPGYRGVSLATTLPDEDNLTTDIRVGKSASGAYSSSPLSPTAFNIGGLAVDDWWVIGYNSIATGSIVQFEFGVGASANSNNTVVHPQYYDGSSWKDITVIEVNADYDGSTPLAIEKNSYHYEEKCVFMWVPPQDWATWTDPDSNVFYPIRFTIAGQATDADVDIAVKSSSLTAGRGNSYWGSVNATIHLMESVQFPDKKRYLLLASAGSRGSTATEGRAMHNITSIDYGSGVRHYLTQGYETDEPGSIAVVPQFQEAFVAYNNLVTVHKAEPTTSDSVIAVVEDRDEYVGTIEGIKSDYHPDYVASSAAFPKAKYLEFFDGQLWAANLTGAPFTVQWSAPQPAYKVWPNESYEILMEDDNSPITGMKAFGEHLAVFKQDSIWRMVYNGVGGVAQLNTYLPVKVPGYIGCVSNSSIQDINGVLLFAAEDGVYAFDGVNKPEKISHDIDKTWATINPGRRRFSAAVHWRSKNMYLLAVSVTGSAYNNLVLAYDYKHGCWWIWDNIDAVSWMRDEGTYDEELIYFGTSEGYIYQLDVGDTDHGAAIESYIETHRMGYGDFTNKIAREVRINAENEDLSSLDITLKRNDEESADQTTGNMTFVEANTLEPAVDDGGTVTVNDSSPSTTYYRPRRERKMLFRKSGDWFRIKVLNDETNKKLRLNRISLGTVRSKHR